MKKLLKSTKMGTVTVSCSQESDIFDENVFNELSQQLPSGLLADDLMVDNKYELQTYLSVQDNYPMDAPPAPPPPPPAPSSAQPLNSYCMNNSDLLSNAEFGGNFNFQYQLGDGSGKSYVYSQKFKKVYINMEQNLPVRFQWTPVNDTMFLRTTLAYSWDEHRSVPINRCLNHQCPKNLVNQNVAEDVLSHVVRCSDPNSVYIETHGHKSVITPLGIPQPGSTYVSKSFQFYCKNSCSSGINRKKTELIFTLENSAFEVMGRKTLAVRVCSCPKRDKEKEEIEGEGRPKPPGRKRKMVQKKVAPIPPPGKKPMILVPANIDNREYTIPIKILGRENVKSTLRAAHGVMASNALMTGEYQTFLPYLAEIEGQLKQFN